jgi:hypothetical protein
VVPNSDEEAMGEPGADGQIELSRKGQWMMTASVTHLSYVIATRGSSASSRVVGRID